MKGVFNPICRRTRQGLSLNRCNLYPGKLAVASSMLTVGEQDIKLIVSRESDRHQSRTGLG